MRKYIINDNVVRKNNAGLTSLLLKVLFILFVWFVTVAVAQEKSFDLYRYYQQAEINYDNLSLIELIEESRSTDVDFIYNMLLYCALSLNIPLNLVTVLIVSTYFFLIISCMKEIYGGKINRGLLFVILFATPTCWIVSISRNLAAIMFLYLGVKFYYHRKWLMMLLFALLAVATHYSVLMYILVFVCAFFLRKIQIKVGAVSVLIFAFITAGIIFPSYVQNVFFDLIAGQDLRYSKYSLLSDSGVFKSAMNYAVRLPTLFAWFFSILLLVLNKKQGFEYWVLFFLTMMLSAFIFSSWTLTNRCLMVLPLFWALNVALIYTKPTVDKNKTLQVVSYIGVFIILLGVYGMRNIYFPSIY